MKGSSVITITVSNATTSISGQFNSRSLSLTNGENRITVSGYLPDGGTASNSVSVKAWVPAFIKMD